MLQDRLEKHQASKRRARFLTTAARHSAITAAALAALLVVYLAVVGWQGSGFIGDPRPFLFPDRPENYGLTYQSVSFPAAVDNVPIAGWLFPDPARQHRLVILVPGFRSHKAHLLREYERWLAERVGVLAFDPRHAGDSGKATCTLGQDERRDVAGAVAFARKQSYTRIVLFGTSMGGAAAIAEGSEDPAVLGIIAEAPPASLQIGLTGLFRAKHYPLPSLAARAATLGLEIRAGHLLGDGDALAHLPHLYPRPFLLIQGLKDHVVAPSNSAMLRDAYAAAERAHPRPCGDPMTYVRFTDADHMSATASSPHYLHRVQYERLVLDFLARTFGPRRPGC